MADVIELRVHGVGGTPPEALVGEDSVGRTVRVAGNNTSNFNARRSDMSVEGYNWGKLTSSALVQPLWILLLPFTLLNVAGWMFPPHGDARGIWFRRIGRVLISLLALSLTATYLLWSAILLTQQVTSDRGLGRYATWIYEFFSNRGLRLGTSREFKFTLSLLLILVAVLLLTVIARWVQKGFESVEGPELTEGRVPGSEKEARSLKGFLLVPIHGLRRMRDEGEPLAHERFWAREWTVEALLYWHLLLVVVALAGMWFVGRDVVGEGSARQPIDPRLLRIFETRPVPPVHFGYIDLLLVLTKLQVVALLVLTVTFFAGWRRPLAQGFRWCGPVVAATTGIALANGFFFGLSLVLNRVTGTAEVPVEPLVAAFGFGSIAFLAAGAAVVGYHLWRVRAELRKLAGEDLPEDQGGPGEEPTGMSSALRAKTAFARSFSDFGRNVDWILTVPAIAFLSVLTITFFDKARIGTDAGIYEYVGVRVTFLGVGAFLFFLFRRSIRPEQRKTIGIIWDVLTFWPRRFHPLAVRPYAERAVPELQRRLYYHVEKMHRKVLLSAHSQGTVIAHAALMQLTRWRPDLTSSIALMTYGTPLRQLHTNFFPAYIGPEHQFANVMKGLHQDPVIGYPGWRNFYRETDYIGKRLFLDTERTDVDHLVADPAQVPRLRDEPFDSSIVSWPDPPRLPYSDLAMHSYYNHEILVKDFVGRLKRSLADAGTAPAASNRTRTRRRRAPAASR